jgi:hypothetical protein
MVCSLMDGADAEMVFGCKEDKAEVVVEGK